MRYDIDPIYKENGIEFKEKIKFYDLTEQDKTDIDVILSGYLRPLPASKLNELIAKLTVICPEKEKTEIDRKLRAKIYIEELSKYPADIAIEVLNKRYRWFPSLAELLDNCDEKMAFRELVKKGLR